jgi:TetR/AcrR family transcriptional regulator
VSIPKRRGRPAGTEAPAPSDEHMLRAALDEFAENGFAGTSVRKLARDLGVSHNLIPQRFGSKERLWYAAVDQGFGALATDLFANLEALPTDDVARLRAMVVRFVELNAKRPALLQIISQEATTPGPRLDYLYDRYIDPVRALSQTALDALHRKGLIRTRSVSLMYFLMTHGAGGPLALPALAARFGARVDPSDPEAVHRHALEAADIIFDGPSPPTWASNP